jgi:hypothetical protein
MEFLGKIIFLSGRMSHCFLQALHYSMRRSRRNRLSRSRRNDEMLDHLWSIWKQYEGEPRRLEVEVGQWLSQYSVKADDFAFSVGFVLIRFAGMAARS